MKTLVSPVILIVANFMQTMAISVIGHFYTTLYHLGWMPLKGDGSPIASYNNWKYTPLQIRLRRLKENSAYKLNVDFYDGASEAGRISLQLNSTAVLSVGIGRCSNSNNTQNVKFSRTLGEDTVVTLTRTNDGILVECHGVTVLNMVLSDETCMARLDWWKYWQNRIPNTFAISVRDKPAAGFYRRKPSK